MSFELPVNYNQINREERKEVRKQYVREQFGRCHFCAGPLIQSPPTRITSLEIDLTLFPKDFLKNPVHLHHNHRTGMTIGAVHAYCNAVLWQYYDE